jgi:hypothetical protein
MTSYQQGYHFSVEVSPQHISLAIIALFLYRLRVEQMVGVIEACEALAAGVFWGCLAGSIC